MSRRGLPWRLRRTPSDWVDAAKRRRRIRELEANKVGVTLPIVQRVTARTPFARPSSPIAIMTFRKCGSQWVRDVLTSHLIAPHSGYRSVEDGLDAQLEAWPSLEPGTIAGPIYRVDAQTWWEAREPDTLGLIILRDPRDLVVSWAYSVAFSHSASAPVCEFRSVLDDMTHRERLLVGIADFATSVAPHMRSWARAETTDQLFVTSYEALVSSPLSEFEQIIEFFGWSVPTIRFQQAVDENSFVQRSGRAPGHEDRFSHFRKAEPGDWRNHFDRSLAQAFELLCGGLLVDLGYESSQTWFLDVASSIDERDDAAPTEARLRSELARERERARLAEATAAARLEVIAEMGSRFGRAHRSKQ